MDDLSYWSYPSPPGWDFGGGGNDAPVSPTEFQTLWRRFQDNGELPDHGPSRRLILRLQRVSDEIDAGTYPPPR